MTDSDNAFDILKCYLKDLYLIKALFENQCGCLCEEEKKQHNINFTNEKIQYLEKIIESIIDFADNKSLN